MSEKVCAIIVTYNRKELVSECLSSVLNQTFQVSDVILFDNASTDGTHDYLEELGLISDSRIHYIYIKENIGAAGAYSEAFILAKTIECDWVWAMDDDTIPNVDCLQRLIEAKDILSVNEKISFLASTIFGENGEFMNLPLVDIRPSSNGYASWYRYLSEGLIKIETATFISLLIKKDAINTCGIPIREFVMWGFDTEYTMRFTHHYGDAYFVGNSVAIHKRKGARALNIEKETSPERIKLYRTLYQSNSVIFNIYRYKSSRFRLVLDVLKNWVKSLKYLFKNNGIRIFREYFLGGVLALKYFSKFEKLINNQLAKG